LSLVVGQTGCSSKSKPQPAQGGSRADGGEAGPDGDAAVRDARPASSSGETEGDARVDAANSPRRDAAAGPDAASTGQVDASSPRPSARRDACGDVTSFPSPLPADTGARTAKLVGSNRFGFVEGPVWIDKLGVLLFSDMDFGAGDAKGPPSRIRRLKPPSSFDVLVESANSNGLAYMREGALGVVMAATHDTQSLTAFDPATGARTDLSVLYKGKHFNSPNDLAIMQSGTVFFSDPDYQLGTRSSEIGSTGVYSTILSLAEDPTPAVLVDGTLQKPNGVALSPDQRTLYVGSSGNEIWKFDVSAAGDVSNRTKFAEVGGSDGMAVDCAGNLYVASGTVEVFAPGGDKLGEISVPENPSNAAFGGTDHKTLYITAQTGLYSIALAVPGFPY
jgi:gluconolactonase